MRSLLFVPYYIRWHYGKALRDIVHITGNFMWFIWHFFSIGLLSRTLFAPWQRLQESNPRDLDIGAMLSTLVVNSIVRGFGAVMKTLFIIMGLITLAGIVCGSIIFFCIWILLPVVVLSLLIVSIRFIILSL